jgi:hypothetical protein
MKTTLLVLLRCLFSYIQNRKLIPPSVLQLMYSFLSIVCAAVVAGGLFVPNLQV